MRKKIITSSIIFCFLFSSNLFADPKEVTPAAKESSLVYEKPNWQPWAVTIVTIAIAATGLIIVSSNRS